MITLYTIDCPKCKVLEKKLEQKNVKYEVCKDREVMSKKGFKSAPILEVDDRVMTYTEAVAWVNTLIINED